MVGRHTRGFKATLRYLLLKGIRAGEFAPELDVRTATDALFAVLEAAVLRLTLTDTAEMGPLVALVRQTLDSLPRRTAPAERP